jgi:hypothetical protein
VSQPSPEDPFSLCHRFNSVNAVKRRRLGVDKNKNLVQSTASLLCQQPSLAPSGKGFNHFTSGQSLQKKSPKI